MNKQQIIAKLLQIQGEVEDLAGLLEDTAEFEQGDDIFSTIGELWDVGSSLSSMVDLLEGEGSSDIPAVDGVPYILTV